MVGKQKIRNDPEDTQPDGRIYSNIRLYKYTTFQLQYQTMVKVLSNRLGCMYIIPLDQIYDK